jgi:hypothetical protein
MPICSETAAILLALGVLTCPAAASDKHKRIGKVKFRVALDVRFMEGDLSVKIFPWPRIPKKFRPNPLNLR